jgi:hypothetical protein
MLLKGKKVIFYCRFGCIAFRVTSLGEVSPMGDCLPLAVFLNAEVAESFALCTFLPKYRLCINFDKKGWAIFWAIFQKLIWSP